MLQLILGRAGSGKTTKLYEILKEKISEEKEFIFLVPEQFSFETEKSIYRILGSHMAKKVKVLSFTRLAYEIFKQYGGLRTRLNDMQKQLLMAVTLNELNDNLSVYGNYKRNTDFINSMVSTADDFKAAGIVGDNLIEVSKLCEEKELKKKLEDLSIIYTAYNAVLERCGADPKDDLTKAVEKASENKYFNNKIVFIDSFMAFSPAEMKMISVLITDSDEVYGAFCTPSLNSVNDVFLPVVKTLKKLIATAKTNGVKTSVPIMLNNIYRFNSQAIKNTEQYFMDQKDSVECTTEGVEIFSASNPYEEVFRAACEIKKAVVENSYKYREIAFITRNIEKYEKLISRIFEKFEIPYYMDKRVDIMVNPLVIGLKSALDCVITDFSTENLLKFAKSPLSGLSAVESAELDNYCYTWSLNAEAWKEDFTANPVRNSAEMTEEEEEKLNKLNESRKQIITPLLKFKVESENPDGKSFAHAVYNLLDKLNAGEKIYEFAEFMPEEKKKEFLALEKALWDNIMDILDIFATLAENINMSLSSFGDLFNLCLLSCDLGEIPQTLDHVIVGQADRIRPDKIKMAFVAGCVDGEFPRQLTSTGILSDSERNKVTGLGLTLTADLEERESYENHYAYFALTRASEKLIVSYPMADLAGKRNEPSAIFTQVKEILGLKSETEADISPWDSVWNFSTATESLGENFDNNFVRSTLKKFIKESGNPEYEINLSNEKKAHRINEKDLSQRLFGRNMNISPSRLDEFYNCKFAYFAKNGLKIKKLEKVDVSAIETGKLIHYVMEKSVNKYGRNLSKLDESQMQDMVRGFLKEYMDNNLDIKNVNARIKYLFERIGESLILIMQHMAKELEQTDFVPVYFEEKIGRNAKFSFPAIECTDGSKITVEGQVDRIDIMEKDGKKYVRVVDYKSGNKKFNISDVNYGLNMQMLIYLFAICPEISPWADMKPAGILYMPSKNIIAGAKNNMDDDEIENIKSETLKMNGLVLNEEAVIFGMEKSGDGIYIPVKMKNGQADRYSSVINIKQMKNLKNKVENNIRKMAEILHEGHVEAVPTVSGNNSPCDYCDYKTACGYLEGDEVRRVKKIPIEEMLGGGEDEQC